MAFTNRRKNFSSVPLPNEESLSLSKLIIIQHSVSETPSRPLAPSTSATPPTPTTFPPLNKTAVAFAASGPKTAVLAFQGHISITRQVKRPSEPTCMCCPPFFLSLPRSTLPLLNFPESISDPQNIPPPLFLSPTIPFLHIINSLRLQYQTHNAQHPLPPGPHDLRPNRHPQRHVSRIPTSLFPKTVSWRHQQISSLGRDGAARREC